MKIVIVACLPKICNIIAQVKRKVHETCKKIMQHQDSLLLSTLQEDSESSRCTLSGSSAPRTLHLNYLFCNFFGPPGA